MHIYILLDLLLVLFAGVLSYYSYRKKSYIRLFEYFKIFVLITISAKLAAKTGVFLQEAGILRADTYSVAILIGFGLNLAGFYFAMLLLLDLLKNHVHSSGLRKLAAVTVSVVQVAVLSSFLLYITMQLTPAKRYLYPHFQKSYLYLHIKRFYIKFLNDDFVYMLLSSETGTNPKEVIFKSFKNSLD